TFSGGMRGGIGPYTLFSLEDGAVVVAGDATSRADSASTAWDLGLRGNEVILNGGTSGPGELRGALVDVAFDVLEAVPAGVAQDGETECPRGEARVVCHGSGNGWYLYAENGVQPIPGKTLVVVRPDGSALKVRFAEYELAPDLGGPRPRYVTLEVAPLAVHEG
ncbi:HmuY family protein, partial [Rubrivirga sp.]|uniref:HmuY family protein n=1 Tax=Rubrivirga sp. TaxID=1885344 RepID=UPI003C7571B2